jgi:hypothetical protein
MINQYVKNIYTGKTYKQFYQDYIGYNKINENSCEKYYAMLEHIQKIYVYYTKKDHTAIVKHMCNDINKIGQFKMCRFQKAINLFAEKINTNLNEFSSLHMENIKQLVTDNLNKDFITNNMKCYELIFSNYYELFVLYPVFNTTINFTIDDLEETDEYKEHRKRIILDITNSQKHLSKIKNMQI